MVDHWVRFLAISHDKQRCHRQQIFCTGGEAAFHSARSLALAVVAIILFNFFSSHRLPALPEPPRLISLPPTHSHSLPRRVAAGHRPRALESDGRGSAPPSGE